MCFSKLSDLRAVTEPDGLCIADDSSNLTNRQFHSRVLTAAGVFADRGVGVGDVVAIMLPNQVEFVVAMFAAWRLGAAVTPMNPALTNKEAAHQRQRRSHSPESAVPACRHSGNGDVLHRRPL